MGSQYISTKQAQVGGTGFFGSAYQYLFVAIVSGSQMGLVTADAALTPPNLLPAHTSLPRVLYGIFIDTADVYIITIGL